MAALTVVNPIPQFFELDGDPLDGGKLYFGVANQNPETSPIPVYWDAAGTIPAAQPVRTSNGYPARAGAPAVLYASTDYSLLVRDKRGRVVFFASNSADFGGSATLGSDLANTTDPAKGPALVGFGRLNYPADTVGGAVFTTVFGDGVSDRTTQLAAANALGLPIRIKGVLHLPSAVTITVPILDTTTQIFTPASFVTIDNGLPVRPEWFGSSAGNIARAVNALPFAVGGTVKFANATYPPSYNTATAAMLNNRGGAPGVDYMVRKRIRFQGDRLPQFNAGETALENGTIIQGPLFIGAECDGFQVDNIGVDSGTTVVNALYAGVEQDGFCIVQTNKTTPITGTQFQIGSVIGLCKLGSTAVHAVLLEAMNGGSIGYAEGRRGYHGVAYKSRNMVVGALVGHGCGGEDVIVKADTYAVCSETQIDSVSVGGLTGVESGVGFQIQAGTLGVSAVNIGKVYGLRKDWTLVVTAGGLTVTDVNVGELIGQSCSGGVQLSGDCRRVGIGRADITATVSSVVVVGVTDKSNTIDSLSVANATTGIDLQGPLRVGSYHADTVTTAIAYNHANARIYLEAYTSNAVTNFWNLSHPLAGTWVNNAGGNPFEVKLENGNVVLYGLISGGAAGLFSTVDSRIRPVTNRRRPAAAFNGAAYAMGEVIIPTTGACTLTNLAVATGGGSYLSLDGVSWPIPY